MSEENDSRNLTAGLARRDLTALRILGVRLDDVTMAETLDLIDAFVRSGAPHQIATVNVEFIMTARRNAPFRQVLENAALCVPDSVGILWAARLLGHPLRGQVAGADLVWEIAALAAARGHRLFLLGAAPGVAELAAARLREIHPSLQIAGTYAGSPAPVEERDIVARIRATQPHILLVAYGAPQQDLWIARNIDELAVPVAMGVGGSLDYIAGAAVRAPLWLRRWGLEWLYRLYRQPWRWRRMLALPQFAALVVRSRVLEGRTAPFRRRVIGEDEETR